MKRPAMRRSALMLGLALGLGGGLASPSLAEEADAKRILKAMADYVTAQPIIAAKIDTDIEVITPELQKIQFASSGEVRLSRPDKLRVSRTGGYADVELVFDGKTVTVLGKGENVFAQLEAPGSVDQLIDTLQTKTTLAMPGSDLLTSHVYDDLISDVIDAKYIGRGVIDGIECEHLAFRNPDTDWQLWVEVGPKPIPRKYVITSKAVTGAPQYTLRIKEWKTDTPASADAFAFSPPAGARKVAVAELSHLDEVPPGIPAGGKR